MADETRLWFQSATLLTMNETNDILHGDLLVEDGKIKAIGEIPPEWGEGAQKRSLAGYVVLPGFVQGHLHLSQILMRNCADDMVLMDWLQKRIWPYEAALTYEELLAGARLGVTELIRSGTTTFLDFGTVHHTDAIGEAIRASGLRGIFGKCLMDEGALVPKPLLQTPEKALQESLDLFHRWDGQEDGRLRYAFCPRFAVSCSDGLLREIAQILRQTGAYLHIHASETSFENDFTHARAKLSNVAYLHDCGLSGEKSLFAHGVHVCEDDCRILASTQTAVAHCPSANLKLASGIADIPRYDRFGVRLALGADGPPCNNNLDPLVELRLAALLQKPLHGPTAMPARRALRLATLDGAKALGLGEMTGSLEVGKSADLVVLDLESDPACGPGGDLFSRIVYSAQRSNIRHVFAQGREVFSKGSIPHLDQEEILQTARSALHTVYDRMQDYIPADLR